MLKLFFMTLVSLPFMTGAIIVSPEENQQNIALEPAAEVVVPGADRQNAYALGHMQYAYGLYNNRRNLPQQKIKAMHSYLQVVPENEAQLELLDRWSTEGILILHEYPLHREILVAGNYYTQPSHEQELYQPLSVVSATYVFPESIDSIVMDLAYEP